MKGLTRDELRCIEVSLPGAPDIHLDDSDVPAGVEDRLLRRGLLRVTRDGSWYEATPVAVLLYATLTKRPDSGNASRKGELK